MATSGKKSKKKQAWKPVDAASLVELTAPRKSNWAEESEELLDPARDVKPVALPTAPRSARVTELDESKVPTMPPFQVHIGNIPYELQDEELAELFRHLKVKSVSLLTKKGHGQVEFEDRASLVAALKMTDATLQGRNLNIELTSSRYDRGGFRDRRGGRDDRGSRDMGMGGPDRTAGDWRSGPRSVELEEPRSNNYDRGGYGGRREGFGGGGGGFGRPFEGRDDRNFDRDRSDRFGGGRDDRSGGGGGRDFDRDRDKGFSSYKRNDDDRGGSSSASAGGWRDGDRNMNFRDRGGGFDGDRGGFDREGGGFGRDRGGYGRDRGGFDRDQNRDRGGYDRDQNRDRDRDNYRDRERDRGGMNRRVDDDLPPVSKEPSKTRPKLQLLPRGSGAPASEEGGEKEAKSSTNAASIFGGAKPVDTAAREREVETRLIRGDDMSEARGTRSGPGSTSGSSQKDFEIERRIEPAPPPKENAWSRNKASAPIVNNGRTTPDENQSTPDEKSEGNKAWTKGGGEKGRSDGKKSDDVPKGGGGGRATGPPLSKSPSGKSVSESSDRGKKDDRPPIKHKEVKKDCDDISKMPKMAETKVPNFADSNKFSQLGDSEEPTD